MHYIDNWAQFRYEMDLISTTPTDISIQWARGKEQPTGIIEAYSAVWGFVPYAYEPAFLAPTAFNRSINNKGTNIGVNYGHDEDTPNMFKNLANGVDDKGTWFRAQTDMDDPEAGRIYNKVRKGFIGQYSVGFVPNIKKLKTDEKTNFPIITEAELYHHSIVNAAANPETHTIATYGAAAEDVIEYLMHQLCSALKISRDQLEEAIAPFANGTNDNDALQENDPPDTGTHDSTDSQLYEAADSELIAHSAAKLEAITNIIMRKIDA